MRMVQPLWYTNTTRRNNFVNKLMNYNTIKKYLTFKKIIIVNYLLTKEMGTTKFNLTLKNGSRTLEIINESMSISNKTLIKRIQKNIKWIKQFNFSDMNEKELISISVYKDVMIDISTIIELKKKIARILKTNVENISIILGYEDSVTY